MKNWWGKYEKGDKFTYNRQHLWDMDFSVTITAVWLILGYRITFIDESGRWVREKELDRNFTKHKQN